MCKDVLRNQFYFIQDFKGYTIVILFLLLLLLLWLLLLLLLSSFINISTKFYFSMKLIQIQCFVFLYCKKYAVTVFHSFLIQHFLMEYRRLTCLYMMIETLLKNYTKPTNAILMKYNNIIANLLMQKDKIETTSF